MPRRLTEQERQERQAINLFITVMEQGEPLGIRHQLTKPLAGMPAGTWIFGTVRRTGKKGELEYVYEGSSQPRTTPAST